ncbi:MAG: glutamate--cysteine ligase, partial [Pseudomonadota bacterium]
PLIGFDEDGTPHLRIEHRTPAAGPTIIDCVANAAFYYGLTQNLCEEMVNSGNLIPFSHARDNFYQAARLGMNAHTTWRNGDRIRLRSIMLSDFIPRATLGLKSLGISRCDIEDYLGIIQRRIETGQNGCAWQKSFMKQDASTMTNMTNTYLNHQISGQPVSEWALC